jgi:hypothetical protein
MKTENEALNCPEVLEALKAERINGKQEDTIRYIIGHHGSEAGLNALKYFEKMNFISAYLKDTIFGFKMREFSYHSKLPKSEKQKIALALEEALVRVKQDQRMDRAMEDYRRREDESQD